jgi:hypothetical protein
MLFERSGHTAVLLKDGRVLIAGGGDSTLAQTSAELYTASPASSATFTAANASGGISLMNLTSTRDKSVFVDIAACNCGGLAMIAETNRTLGLNAGPNQVGSSTIITKSPAGNDTMPWTAGAVQATQAGVVYPPLLNTALANLAGRVTDDGLPSGTIQTTWSEFSGPAPVTFANASALNTTATFSTAGTYVLRLTASDTALSSSADVTIIVNGGDKHGPGCKRRRRSNHYTVSEHRGHQHEYMCGAGIFGFGGGPVHHYFLRNCESG